MEHSTRTYFTENEADDVKGFTIIDTNEDSDQYHIAEKWSRSDEEGKWIQYWIPADKLAERVANDKCEPKATLTQEQYEKVCEMIDLDGVVAEPATA